MEVGGAHTESRASGCRLRGARQAGFLDRRRRRPERQPAHRDHAEDRAAVDAFYRAALAAGGKDNGAPGLRPQYHPDYYGAFVLDPDGHNVEAVCHAPA